MPNLWLLHFGLAVAMFIVTAIGGLASIKVTNRVRTATGKSSLTLSLLSCFTGGVFLGTCFLDILPHIDENFEKFKRNSSLKSTFPFPNFLTCVGFFAIYALEEVMDNLFKNKSSHSKGYQTPDEAALNAIYGNGAEKGDQSGLQSTRGGKDDGIFRAMVLTVCMSFHSLLEGFALGVQTNYSETITLFISLILHKGIESFSVGLQVARAGKDRTRLVVVTILIYALMTPAGSITAVSIWNLDFDHVIKGGALVTMEALAVGTFIYATFLEIIAVERANEHSNICQLIATLVGFALVAMFQVGEGYIQKNL